LLVNRDEYNYNSATQFTTETVADRHQRDFSLWLSCRCLHFEVTCLGRHKPNQSHSLLPCQNFWSKIIRPAVPPDDQPTLSNNWSHIIQLLLIHQGSCRKLGRIANTESTPTLLTVYSHLSNDTNKLRSRSGAKLLICYPDKVAIRVCDGYSGTATSNNEFTPRWSVSPEMSA